MTTDRQPPEESTRPNHRWRPGICGRECGLDSHAELERARESYLEAESSAVNAGQLVDQARRSLAVAISYRRQMWQEYDRLCNAHFERTTNE